MTKFVNISELEILRIAYYDYITKWNKATKKLEKIENQLLRMKIDKYEKIMEELRVRILELEEDKHETLMAELEKEKNNKIRR